MFWERFLAECDLVGKKPNPVAKELGVSSGTVTGWKRGALPKPEVLSRIASYFNVSVDYLIGKTDIKEKPTIGRISEPYVVWGTVFVQTKRHSLP